MVSDDPMKWTWSPGYIGFTFKSQRGPIWMNCENKQFRIRPTYSAEERVTGYEDEVNQIIGGVKAMLSEFESETTTLKREVEQQIQEIIHKTAEHTPIYIGKDTQVAVSAVVEKEDGNQAPAELSKKHQLKSEVKRSLNKRFKFCIGSIYVLKSKSKVSAYRTVKEYVVRQIIWTMNEIPVNALVVKQISGPTSTGTSFLNVDDCKHLHVKYERGLQILSMTLNWQPKKQ